MLSKASFRSLNTNGLITDEIKDKRAKREIRTANRLNCVLNYSDELRNGKNQARNRENQVRNLKNEVRNPIFEVVNPKVEVSNVKNEVSHLINEARSLKFGVPNLIFYLISVELCTIDA